MELIEETKESAALRFTRMEYAILSDILRVFEYKMQKQQIDYQMLMDTEEEAQRFLDSFSAIFDREK